MSEWLEKVFELHSEWLKIAKVYGAGDLAEDFVQDTYLKLHKYASPEKVITEGRVNKGYVFFTLKTIVMQHHEDKMLNAYDFHQFRGDTHVKSVDMLSPRSNERHSISNTLLLSCEDQYEENDVEELWKSIDRYTQKNYPLPKRILYKMWKARYNVREIAYCTDVSTPTIVKDLKEIRDDIAEKFKGAWQKAQE